MDQAIGGLHQAVDRFVDVQRSHHPQRIEREETFQELCRPVGIRARAANGRPGRLRRVGQERRPYTFRVGHVGEHFVRRDFGQRLDPATRARLHLVDVAVEVIHVSAAGNEPRSGNGE